MTNDSNLFITRGELEKSAYPTGGGHWKHGNEEFVPLYEGKMVQMFDHRAANVVVNLQNLKRPASQEAATIEEHQNPSWVPEPQFWVSRSHIVDVSKRLSWTIGFKHVTASTNVRSMIAAMIPSRAAGNSLPIIIEDDGATNGKYVQGAPLLLANFCAIPLDYVLRQKVQGQNLNWFIIEQLPVIPREAYARKFGKKSAIEIVKDDVLALTYTANDMEPFARDMGYAGKPFAWDEADRARRRARLDALYFMLYFPSGTKAEIETLRDTAHYIFSTFPIVERQDTNAHGRYLSRDLCLAYINALAAGDADAEVKL